MIIIIYFRQKVKIILKNNQSKRKILLSLLLEKKINFQFYLRPVNTPGSNNIKEHKADRKKGKGGYMCGFHMYPKLFMKFLQILQGQSSGVHCLIHF